MSEQVSTANTDTNTVEPVAPVTTAVNAAKPAKAVAKASKATPARAVAKPAKIAVRTVAAYGSKAEIIVTLGKRKQGMTAAEIREATGWKSVSAKAMAERFGGTHDLKVVAVERKDGTAAYRLT